MATSNEKPLYRIYGDDGNSADIRGFKETLKSLEDAQDRFSEISINRVNKRGHEQPVAEYDSKSKMVDVGQMANEDEVKALKEFANNSKMEFRNLYTTPSKGHENSIEQDIERTIDVAKEAIKIDKTDVAKYGASVAVDNVTGLGAVKVPVEAAISTHNAYDAIDKSAEVNKALNKDDKVNPPKEAKEEPKEVNDPVEPKGKKDQDTGDKTPPKTEDEVPKTLLNKYHLVDHKFHYRNDPDKVAFEDTGKTLKTDTNDKEIARSMVELAEAKKWDTIKVKGTEEFKRTVWLEASLKGMNVKGYEPKDVDIAMLNDLKKPDQEIKNTIERGEDRLKEIPKEKTLEPKPLTQTPEEVRQEKIQNLSEKERALLTIFDRKMQAENFTEKQRTVSMDQAIDKLHDKQIHVGKLVDHGHAPYKNDPKNDQSYFATLENEKGQKHTLWAKDLERTLREQNIIKNDDIVLTYKGSKQVEVDTKEIDPKTGLPTGHRVHTVANRGKWEAQSLSKLKATTEKELTKNHQTKLQVQHEAELKQSRSFSQPKIQAYSATAPKQQPQVQQQKQTKEREKNKEIPR